MATGWEFESRQGQGPPPDRFLGRRTLLCDAYWEIFLRRWIGRGVKLTTRLQLMLGSRKRGFVSPIPHTTVQCLLKYTDNFASNRNEYQRDKFCFWGVDRGRLLRLTTLRPSVSRLSRQCRVLDIWQPYRPPRPATGIALLPLFFFL
jgi:hypothetical protein